MIKVVVNARHRLHLIDSVKGSDLGYLQPIIVPTRLPAIEVASRHRLSSANRHRLIVPRCGLNTYGRRAFPVAGPTVWNSLPDELRDPACDVDSFKQFFKQSCSALTSVTSALEVINVMHSINPRFTYLLTYLLTYQAVIHAPA